jgi:hypothetical protein
VQLVFAQEEDEASEDILRRNVVLLAVLEPLLLIYDFRRVRQSSQNQVPAIALQSFPGHHYAANLGTIIHIPLISRRSSPIFLISTKEGL